MHNMATLPSPSNPTTDPIIHEPQNIQDVRLSRLLSTVAGIEDHSHADVADLQPPMNFGR